MKAQIKCYSPESPIMGLSFFVLNKGRNTGKPLRQPTANCFVVITDNQEDLDRYYYLSWAVWQAGGFLPYLCGSVIDFIHIDDYKTVMEKAECMTSDYRDKFTESVSKMADVEVMQAFLRERLQKIIEVKRAMLANLLRL